MFLLAFFYFIHFVITLHFLYFMYFIINIKISFVILFARSKQRKIAPYWMNLRSQNLRSRSR